MTDNEVKFYEWRFDDNEVVQWKRIGECNQCGDCCRTFVRFGFRRPGLPPDTTWADKGLDAHSLGPYPDHDGIWHEIRRGNLRRFFKLIEVGPVNENSPCGELAENGTCNIQQNKGLFRKMWPAAPNQVEPFEKCSYSFEEIGRWPIDDIEDEG